MNKKAQVGLETLLIFSIILIFFLFAYTFFLSRSSEATLAGYFLEGKKICDVIRTSIDETFANGFGFRAKLSLPTTLDGKNYSVHFNSLQNFVLVAWDTNSVSCVISTKNVTNSTQSTFKLEAGDYFVKNKDGIVSITKS